MWYNILLGLQKYKMKNNVIAKVIRHMVYTSKSCDITWCAQDQMENLKVTLDITKCFNVHIHSFQMTPYMNILR